MTEAWRRSGTRNSIIGCHPANFRMLGDPLSGGIKIQIYDFRSS